MFVGVITVVFVMAAVVIDGGLWLAERRSVQRASDLAAAAGAQDLLVSDSDAIAAAYTWAGKNGYPAADVNVQLLCYNSLSSSAICHNPNPGAGPVACNVGEMCDSLRVTISKPSTMLFSSIFGVGSFDIRAGSSAGLTVQSVPVDTVLALDATGSMAFGCNAQFDNPGCPAKEARDAANQLVDVLLGGLNSGSQVGYAPYNYCYNPTFGNGDCIRGANPTPAPAPTPNYPSNLVPLTSSSAPLHASINTTTPRGGTNVCLGLDRAGSFMNGAPAGTRKNLILLTDGEGRVFYPDASYPPVCRPPGNINISGCSTTEPNEGALDVLTLQRANALKAQGDEIFVVALLLCETPDARTQLTPGYCAGVGNSDLDVIADQRLLKCAASSPDDYVRIHSASEIPDAFRQIAAAIISRGLLE